MVSEDPMRGSIYTSDGRVEVGEQEEEEGGGGGGGGEGEGEGGEGFEHGIPRSEGIVSIEEMIASSVEDSFAAREQERAPGMWDEPHDVDPPTRSYNIGICFSIPADQVSMYTNGMFALW